MRARNRLLILLLVGAFWSGWAGADITRTGEIVGTVKSDDLAALPGASVTLTGEVLIQRSITQITDSRGTYRFTNLLPGEYMVSVTMDGFATSQTKVTVNVGRTSTIDVAAPDARGRAARRAGGGAARRQDDAAVLQTNYDATAARGDPVEPQLHRRRRHGSRPRQSHGLRRGRQRRRLRRIRLRRRDEPVPDQRRRHVEPSVRQRLGQPELRHDRGSPARRPRSLGRILPVHGRYDQRHHEDRNERSSTAAPRSTGRSSAFQANNDGGIIDLDQPATDYEIEANAYIGGPIIAEKLLFFASGAYNPSSQAPIQTTTLRRRVDQGYQLRLDYLANNANTISAMYDYEPIM